MKTISRQDFCIMPSEEASNVIQDIVNNPLEYKETEISAMKRIIFLISCRASDDMVVKIPKNCWGKIVEFVDMLYGMGWDNNIFVNDNAGDRSYWVYEKKDEYVEIEYGENDYKNRLRSLIDC